MKMEEDVLKRQNNGGSREGIETSKTGINLIR